MKLFNNQKEYEKFTKSLCELFDIEYTQKSVDFEDVIQFSFGVHVPPWNKGLSLSDWHKQSISDSTKGRIWTTERNQKVSQAKLNHWSDENSIYNSEEFRRNQSKKGKIAKKGVMKPVVAKHKNGTILYAESVTEMCKIMECGYTNIKRILDGTRKTHKGWKFYYREIQE